MPRYFSWPPVKLSSNLPILLTAMKIIQSSNVRLGAAFSGQEPKKSGQAVSGDKLRVAIKNAYVKLIDLTIEEKADLLILAGDTFDSPDISQNLLNFFLDQIRRLEQIPAVILPGARDPFQKGSFWEEWQITSPVDNLHILADPDKPFMEIANLSTTVYGYPTMSDSGQDNPVKPLKKTGNSANHIAVIYGNLIQDKSNTDQEHSFSPKDLTACGFNYAALGGRNELLDLTAVGIRAAYSGSPEVLTAESTNSGKCLVVTMDGDLLSVQPKQVGSLEWKEAKISIEEAVDLDGLKSKIATFSGPDVILKATLEGLALFESGFNINQLHDELQGNFLDLEFIDRTRVLPDISEIKVQEKTILGQYLKVMVERLKKAEGDQRLELEESLKTGYTLLTGKEIR
jgi:DNA repair protein SbcD/Mre11